MFESALKGEERSLIWSYIHFDLQVTTCASLSLHVATLPA
jgi:hypothetical protein